MKKRSVLIVLIAIFLVFSFSTTAIFAKADVEVIKEFLRSDVVFKDLMKFKDAVDSEESRKMLTCMLEIYPDFVEEMKKCITDDPDSNTASVIPPFNPMLLSAAIGVVAGVAGTLIVVAVKKKKLQ